MAGRLQQPVRGVDVARLARLPRPPSNQPSGLQRIDWYALSATAGGPAFP
jgi:hypothetical protein